MHIRNVVRIAANGRRVSDQCCLSLVLIPCAGGSSRPPNDRIERRHSQCYPVQAACLQRLNRHSHDTPTSRKLLQVESVKKEPLQFATERNLPGLLGVQDMGVSFYMLRLHCYTTVGLSFLVWTRYLVLPRTNHLPHAGVFHLARRVHEDILRSLGDHLVLCFCISCRLHRYDRRNVLLGVLSIALCFVALILRHRLFLTPEGVGLVDLVAPITVIYTKFTSNTCKQSDRTKRKVVCASVCEVREQMRKDLYLFDTVVSCV